MPRAKLASKLYGIDYDTILQTKNGHEHLSGIYRYLQYKYNETEKKWYVIIDRSAPYELFKDILIVICFHADAVQSQMAYANDDNTAVDEIYIVLPTDRDPELVTSFGKEFEHNNVILRKLFSYTHWQYNCSCLAGYDYRIGENGIKKSIDEELARKEEYDNIRRNIRSIKRSEDKDDIMDDCYEFEF